MSPTVRRCMGVFARAVMAAATVSGVPARAGAPMDPVEEPTLLLRFGAPGEPRGWIELWGRPGNEDQWSRDARVVVAGQPDSGAVPAEASRWAASPIRSAMIANLDGAIYRGWVDLNTRSERGAVALGRPLFAAPRRCSPIATPGLTDTWELAIADVSPRRRQRVLHPVAGGSPRGCGEDATVRPLRCDTRAEVARLLAYIWVRLDAARSPAQPGAP